MKNTRKKCKQLLALTLTAALLVTEFPMTAFAASAEETVTEDFSEAELFVEETETFSEAQSEEATEIETTLSTALETEIEIKTETKTETETPSEAQSETISEILTEAASETEITESSEEQTETIESTDDLAVSSASDFVITNGVLTSYTGTATDVVIPDGVVSIANRAFENCVTIKTVTFSSTVETVGEWAFSGCSKLNNVTLNEGLKTIKYSAFSGVPLGERDEDTNVVTYGKLEIPSTVEFIGSYAFEKCEYLGEIEFLNATNTLLEMDVKTFEECKNLVRVVLPDRLKILPRNAFNNCEKLEEVTFGDQLEEIGNYAFSNCANLKAVTFPSTMDTVGEYAFSGCSRLKNVTLNEGLKTIKLAAFASVAFGGRDENNVITLGKLEIPSTVEFIGGAAFAGCEYLKEIEFADGKNTLLEIESSGTYKLFGECPNLVKVDLPDRLKILPNNAFTGCEKLEDVIFGDQLEEIKNNAFSACTSLEEITFPSTVTTIGEQVFYKCSKLKSITLNEGLKIIKADVFWDAPLGESAKNGGTVTIPSTVYSMDIEVFRGCAYLKTVVFANGKNVLLTMKRNTFYECPELTTVILPERLEKLEGNTFNYNTKLEKVYIPETVKEIADNAIANCPKVTVYGVKGSEAETYAKKNNIPFKDESELDVGLTVTSVKLTPSVIEEIGEEAIGKTTQLSVEVLPDTAQNRKVTYQSNNEEVATISENGLVTIKGFGEATITVTTDDGGKTAKCEVSVLKEAKDERPEINSVLFPAKKTEYSAIYTGEQIRPVMVVSYEYTDDKGNLKTQKLKLNVDYTVRYSYNVNAGENTATVTVSGIGEYKGTATKRFTIKPKSIAGVALSPVGDIVFGGQPSVTVTDGTKELAENTDYKIKLSTTGTANADTPSVLTVEGKGNYTGVSKKSAKFNILKSGTEIQPITSANISVALKPSAKGYTYNGKAQKPAVVVTDTATGKKVSSSMYKVIYANNINVGTGTAKAWVVGVSKNGKGYYGISAPLSFDIKPKDFSKVSASLSGTIPKAGSMETVKDAIKDAITVKDAKHILSDDEYTIDYGEIANLANSRDIEIGKKYPITLTAKADGNYVSGSKKTIHIKFGQLNLASKTAKVFVRVTDASKGEVLLSYNGARLIKDVDYTATVKQDKNKDTYTVKIKAVKGSAYKGSRTVKDVTM